MGLWFVLWVLGLSARIGLTAAWQLECSIVTAAFAAGPAHFRSCLGKFLSTWWLVRSNQSSASPVSTCTNTPSSKDWKKKVLMLTGDFFLFNSFMLASNCFAWGILDLIVYKVISFNYKSEKDAFWRRGIERGCDLKNTVHPKMLSCRGLHYPRRILAKRNGNIPFLG